MLEFTLGASHEPMLGGMFMALSSGRGMQVHTCHSVVQALSRLSLVSGGGGGGGGGGESRTEGLLDSMLLGDLTPTYTSLTNLLFRHWNFITPRHPMPGR